MIQDRVRCAVPAPGTVGVGSTVTLGAATAGCRSFLGAFGAGQPAFFVLTNGADRTISGIWTVNSTTPETATVTAILGNDRLGGTAGETFSGPCVAFCAIPSPRQPFRDAAGNMVAGGRISALAAPSADDDAARRRDVGAEFLRTTPAITGNPGWIEVALDAGFSAYEFTLVDIAPTINDAQLIAQISRDGGATWVQGNSDYTSAQNGWLSGGPVSGLSNTSAMLLTFPVSSAQTAAARVLLTVPPAGSSVHHFMSDFTGISSDGVMRGSYAGICGAVGTRANRIRVGWNGSSAWANRGRVIQRGIRP